MKKYNIRYNPFTGDSSSRTAVEKERPYRAALFVDKEKCVSHTTKRMGNILKVLNISLKTYYFKFCLLKTSNSINYKGNIAVEIEGVTKQILIFIH